MTLVKVNNRPALKTWNGLVNDLFADLEHSLGQSGVPSVNRSIPAVNIIETVDGFHAELLAPGRNKEYFSLEIDKNQLIISYKAEQKEIPAECKSVRREFTIGDFKRSFTLDETMNAEGIQARYEDGILKIFIPKKAVVKPVAKTIEIQ